VLARELLDHGVVIGLQRVAPLAFGALERGVVWVVVVCWVVPVVIGRLVRRLRVQGGWLGVEPAGWYIPAVGHVVVVVVVWRGGWVRVVRRPVSLVRVLFEFRVGDGGWELVLGGWAQRVPAVDRAAAERRGGLWRLVRRLVRLWCE
jgi:hypothetical protein